MTGTTQRAVLKVVFAGPYVSVQDGGRQGMMRFGVPRSGPMDRLGFTAANLALGNDADAAGVEVSAGGITLECVEGTLGFAVAGGGFLTQVSDGGAVPWQPSWWRGVIQAGQRLIIRPGRWGAWTNLAFAGQLLADEWLGARATHVLSGFGGGDVVTGQKLVIEAPRPATPLAIPCPVLARPRGLAHVVMGPQDGFFSAEARADFLNSSWRLTNAYDRMGMRLAGPEIAPGAVLDMPSEGIMRGAVQVAGDGVPVVLQADHQTTGGYPKIATVIDADLDAFVQGRPGDAVNFKAITPDEAIAIARTRHQAVTRYLDGIRRVAAEADAAPNPRRKPAAGAQYLSRGA